MKRLAVLGGTFNPVHSGHLMLAEAALTQERLDGVLWVPSRYAAYKVTTDLLDLSHRLEMVQRAIALHPAFHLVQVDQPSVESSYALHVFQHLQANYPKTCWHWIVGLDAFRSLPRWYGRDQLIPQCTWLVAPRLDLSALTVADIQQSGLDPNTPLPTCLANFAQRTLQTVSQTLNQQGIPIQWRSLQMPLIPLSSRLIRHYCQTQQSIRYLVPEGVYDYIQSHRLYRSPNR
jgi:nicotinate-nucleotide adenylyltransferase